MEKLEIYSGTINGFSGSWGSGLANLWVNGKAVPCENAATVRALAGAFGRQVFGAGHTVNIEAIKGKRILFSFDEFGLILGGFTPEDQDADLFAALEANATPYEIREF